MKKLVTSVSVIVSMFIMIGVVFYNANPDFIPLFFDDVNNKNAYDYGSIVKGFVYFFAMCIGIVFGRMYASLSASISERIDIVNEIKNTLKSKPFVMAALASPIIFSVVYTTVSKEASVLMSLIFSFQNGFFCDGVINSQRKKAENKPVL